MRRNDESSMLEGNSTARRRVVKFKPGPTIAAAAVILVAIAALLTSVFSGRAVAHNSEALATPESFAAINDTAARSAALFTEAGKVLTHPRCVNCHPAGDRPRQGDDRRLHQPPVEGGADGFGLPAMRCPICHQPANFEPSRVPGDPAWHLAPRDMAWEGKTLGQICAQIKDPARNGGRSLDEIVHHVGADHLVGWAWAPGGDRRPAPGTQMQAGALLDAWVKTGAVCPN
jgi:hypothetical protein